jgi:hypothetical protein
MAWIRCKNVVMCCCANFKQCTEFCERHVSLPEDTRTIFKRLQCGLRLAMKRSAGVVLNHGGQWRPPHAGRLLQVVELG